MVLRYSICICLVAISNVAFPIASTGAECDGLFTVATGTLGGGGQVNGDLTNIGGSLAPGSGVGRFTIMGNYCQLPDAEVVFEIGGTQLGVEHDFLWVNGTADFSGGFRIELVDDFVPANGDSFTLMNLRDVEGQFDSFTLPDLGANRWDLTNLLDSGVVSVVPEPPHGAMGAVISLLWLLLRRIQRRANSI